MTRIAVQMDPPEKINIKGDTTFALMAEAQRRGMECYEFQPQDVAIENGEITARMRRAEVHPDRPEAPFTLGPIERHPLRKFPFVLVRQDPPFDMAYYSNTYLLELLPPETRVLNNPRAIRAYEKAGYVTEGRMRQAHYAEGQYFDVILMSVLRQDWQP